MHITTLLAIATYAVTSVASAQLYDVVILQPVERAFEGSSTIATAINSHGDIVGYFDDGDRYGAWWPAANTVNASGNFLEIVHLTGELKLPFYHQTIPYDVNDSVTAVGLSNVMGFWWEPLAIHEFGPPSGYDFFVPRSINAFGHTGGYADGVSDNDAFYYDGSWINVGDFIDDAIGGDHDSIGLAVNDQRLIVGQVEVDSDQHGFAYDLSDDTFYDFGTIGGGYNIPADVNNWGVIVGESEDASGDLRPYVLIGFDTYYEIGTFGLINGRANAINDVAEVVGSAWDNPFIAPPRAFLWRAGESTDLTSLIQSQGYANYTLTSGRDINGIGQIVATGDTTQQRNVSFLLTPINGNLDFTTPEPPHGGRENRYTVRGATPQSTQYFVAGLADGRTRPPVCDVVIQIDNPRVIGTATADILGTATISAFASQTLSGRRVFHQVFERETCRVSDVEILVYQ